MVSDQERANKLLQWLKYRWGDDGVVVAMLDQSMQSMDAMEQRLHDLESKLQQIEQTPRNPWEMIPDLAYDRKLVELWHSGQTVLEIAKQLDKDDKTIEGRISALRNLSRYR